MPIWNARGRTILGVEDRIPRVMGILNVTPDSFSDGAGRLLPDEAVSRGQALARDGADILDIGGESTRPGAKPIQATEERLRVIPVLERLASTVKIPISIDTTKAEVARDALAAGAVIINDITSLEGDPAMSEVAAESGAAVVLMHMQGTPLTMQVAPQYENVLIEVYDYLARRIEWCESRAIPRDRIAIDPGIGFGKTFEHNLLLLRNLDRFANLGCTLLVGTSRKSLLGTLTGRAVSERMVASVVSSLAACTLGASVVRVHDVAPMVDAIRVWTALRGWENS